MSNDRKKLGPVSAQERQDYLARLGSDRECGRPTEKTARAVWELLKDTLPVQVEDLMPKSQKKPPSAEEYDRRVLVAKQSLVVALDCAITASDQSRMLTQNLLLADLARYWSDSFYRATRRGVSTFYDVRPDTTAPRSWRELECVGVRVDTLWRIVAGSWSRSSGKNPLFWVSHVYDERKKHPLGWQVTIRVDALALRAFERTVQEDRQYRRHEERRLLLADNWKPTPRRVRQEVCAEQPFNVVNLGKESERVLATLEQAQVKFNVEVFRHDYEAVVRVLDENLPIENIVRVLNLPSTASYRKLRTFVSAYRRVYQQTEGIPLEVIEDDDLEEPLRPRPISGYRWIKSRFFRAANRRFHASDFWPEHVDKELRPRWFGVEITAPGKDDVIPALDPADVEHVVTDPYSSHGQFVNLDISSSQTQILAAFLGLPELEKRATSESPKFKEYLAQQLWAWHQKHGVLAEGYTGADDPRLVKFIKEHWMRYMYGGKLTEVVIDLGKEPTEYGPGWRTTKGLWEPRVVDTEDKKKVVAQSGVAEAEHRAIDFLAHGLPSWADEIYTFLEACRHLADVYDRKDGDHIRGVVFYDPLDKSEVRWHHAQRGRKILRFGHYRVEVHPWGRTTRHGFVLLPSGTVDRGKLSQFVPPCLIHMLDAYFSGLVIAGLHDAGITNVVALHDAWFVPESVQLPSGTVECGADVLADVISEAGAEWFEGLKDIYDRLIDYLGDDPTFGEFIHGIKARWEQRVRDQKWPRFTTG